MGTSNGGPQGWGVCPLIVMCPVYPWLVLLRELMQIPESGPTQPLQLHTNDPISLYPMYSTVATLHEIT